MLNIFLIISYLGCLSSNQMLSMLLLLVLSYLFASIWFISNGVIYTGLLYILVYVGAIVVLIMFVVQLTNTSLTGDNSVNNNYQALRADIILIISIFLLLIIGYYSLNHNTLALINFTNINLTHYSNYSNHQLINQLENQINTNFNSSNLSTLANSIFNEYGFILIISVHAIVLAIIGPIKLALSSTN